MPVGEKKIVLGECEWAEKELYDKLYRKARELDDYIYDLPDRTRVQVLVKDMAWSANQIIQEVASGKADCEKVWTTDFWAIRNKIDNINKDIEELEGDLKKFGLI
jgi:Zn-dependent oligopeptidase